jgi:hypothetical protein
LTSIVYNPMSRLRRHCYRWLVRSQFYGFSRLHGRKSLLGGRSSHLSQGDMSPFWSCSEKNHKVGSQKKIPIRDELASGPIDEKASCESRAPYRSSCSGYYPILICLYLSLSGQILRHKLWIIVRCHVLDIKV